MKSDPITGRVLRENLTAMRFGTVTVLPEYEKTGNGGTKWKYKCDCGNEGWAWAEVLKRQPSFCCRECRKIRLRKLRTIHGKRHTPKYRIWQSMIRRCENPKHKAFPDYGGRGIKVCERWHSFQAFDVDTGEIPPGLSIDRINNDGNYEPGNVRWATQAQQMNNQRRNKFLTYQGKMQTWSQWSRELGIDKTLIRQRANKGWTVEKILSVERFHKSNP